MSPTYFLASVMLVMFWAILLSEDDSYDLRDDENSLTLSPLSLLRQSILFMSGRSGRGSLGGRGGGCGNVQQPGSNVVVDIDVLPPFPPSRPRTRSRGRDDGYMHKEVDIAPDGENGNEDGTEEPEPDARPAQRNKEANKKKRSKKSKKRSKNHKRKHSSSDSDSSSSFSSSSSSSKSDTNSNSAYHRKNKSKKKFKVKLASKHILNLKRPAKERHDRLVELNKPLHRALKHAESNLNDVQKRVLHTRLPRKWWQRSKVC